MNYFGLFLGYLGFYSPPPLNKWIAKIRGVNFEDIKTTWIGIGTFLDNKNPSDIFIGKNVTISNKVTIYTHSEPPESMRKFGVYYYESPVFIGSNVYIGANTTILPGIRIQNDCIIGACSVVTKDVESFSIVAGNPAKKIKELKKIS